MFLSSVQIDEGRDVQSEKQLRSVIKQSTREKISVPFIAREAGKQNVSLNIQKRTKSVMIKLMLMTKSTTIKIVVVVVVVAVVPFF